MAIKIPYTSRVDGFVNVLRILSIFFWFSLAAILIALPFSLMGIDDFDFGNTAINIVAIVIYFSSCAILSTYIHQRYVADLLNNVSAFLYIRISLRAPIAWNQINSLSWMFVNNTTGKWYPLKEVQRLPKEKRVEYILKYNEHLTC